jgi:hypothetical protein
MRRPLPPALLLGLALLGRACPAAEPVFVARTTAGKVLRGPLHRLGADWSIELGKGVRHKVADGELVSLRREGAALPPFPADEQVILANGDRVPVQDLRLDDEKLHFRHKDLGDGELSLPLSAVAVIWRTAPDGVVGPEQFRRRLTLSKRTTDLVLLRNGDRLEGTLNALGGGAVEMEVARKPTSTRWAQVAAVALSSELAERQRPKGTQARVVLADEGTSPGGRITLASATSEGDLLRGRTAFGALVRIPVEKVVALEITGGKVDYLSSLKPAKYVYRPYLDERWRWWADANALGRDMRLAGSTYDRGVGMHASSSLSYALEGEYRTFEATVGLDDRDGIKGRARVRVLRDGKPVDLGGKGVLTRAGGPMEVRVDVEGAKVLTLEVEPAGEANVQGVVNWANARLIR